MKKLLLIFAGSHTFSLNLEKCFFIAKSVWNSRAGVVLCSPFYPPDSQQEHTVFTLDITGFASVCWSMWVSVHRCVCQ